MFWSAQFKTILKAEVVWRFVCGDDAASSISHGEEMDTMEAETRAIIGKYLTRAFACTLIL